MLDHLEKSTGRLYQSGLVLKDEARVHNQLLDGRGCLFVCLLVCLFVCLVGCLVVCLLVWFACLVCLFVSLGEQGGVENGW